MRIISIIIFVSMSFWSFSQKENVQQYILSQAKSLDISAENFNGLSFLDTLLAGKRIVMLGESSHGTEEYSEYKFYLIRYLHEKLGFNVLLFESPMMLCGYVNIAKDSATAIDLIKNSIQSVWHTKTVERLFNYIKETDLSFNGFDPQLMISNYQTSLFRYALITYPAIQKELIDIETQAAIAMQTGGKQYLSLRKKFAGDYANIALRLNQLPLSSLQQWVKQIVTINSSYYQRIQEGDQRDSCMAKNIIWLAENFYPNEKIIVWAHNTHIDKNATTPKRIMGKMLALYFNDQLYGIGLYMTHGQTALNNRKIITIKKPLKGSLEEMAGNTGLDAAFIQTGNEIFNRKTPTWHWGKDRQAMNLSKNYDAVIVINQVSAPVYLP